MQQRERSFAIRSDNLRIALVVLVYVGLLGLFYWIGYALTPQELRGGQQPRDGLILWGLAFAVGAGICPPSVGGSVIHAVAPHFSPPSLSSARPSRRCSATGSEQARLALRWWCGPRRMPDSISYGSEILSPAALLKRTNTTPWMKWRIHAAIRPNPRPDCCSSGPIRYTARAHPRGGDRLPTPLPHHALQGRGATRRFGPDAGLYVQRGGEVGAAG